MGASEAIYSRVPEHKIVNSVSPIVLMKAKKNAAERAGMRKAHIIDGAAMCETLSYIEQRVSIRMKDTLLLLYPNTKFPHTKYRIYNNEFLMFVLV